ncbi:DNA helicase PcrA [Serpentinicella sp. ANB-PHB4]|uniref:DNA helicase PcrA n=1 Tax=Serpentinicella sp. ANB-PHB4 TaxID=3074076 RepID=UPI00285E5B06|nr:DNA helicase PcrA [Serpentinicella sp. ANB-PHB4]MDR5658618.1 DNA helicase PcrA [Serpentinicella sp. ANB-PHB4]
MNLNHLNGCQKEAVLHTEGPLLVLAGAGSGKTRVLTHRIAYLIKEKGISPYNILAITFTNKAAREMKERIDALLGFEDRSLWVSTFHSTCVRILRMEIEKLGYNKNFVIYDASDQQVVIKACLKKLNINEKTFDPRGVLSAIGKAKDQLITPEEYKKSYVEDFWTEKIAEIYGMYQKELKSNNALDFDDLIMKTVQLFEQFPLVLEYYHNKFKYILVDEFQDTNMAQYTLVSLLSKSHQNLCVVGDDDQSIYGWRGADISNILGFEKDFPKAEVIKLEENYRSTKKILDAANHVVARNEGRKDKNLWTGNDEGEIIGYYCADNEYDESRFIAYTLEKLMRQENRSYKDFAILYRTNAQSRVLEDGLMKSGIPYRMYGGTRFFERKEIKDIIAYLIVIENSVDDLSVRRVINVPKRGIGAKAIERLEAYAESTGESFFHALVNADEVPGLSASQRKNIKGFTQMILELQDQKDELTITEITDYIYEKSGYIESLLQDGTVESQSRVENLEEFKSLTLEFDKNSEEKTLDAFLAKNALESATDSMDDEDNAVVLMTLHSAKGLEFPVVFIPGMEENIFPSPMSLKENNEEEERRLCYVGITRAMQRLYMTHTKMRTLYGRTQYNSLSRFVNEIPNDLIDRPELYNRKKQVQAMKLSPVFKGQMVHNDKPVQKDKTKVLSGSKVKHPSFGIGTVVATNGSIVTIAFDGAGVKKIDTAFIPLTTIE